MSTDQPIDKPAMPEWLRPFAKLLPFVALFLRVSVGLSLLNQGLLRLNPGATNGFGGMPRGSQMLPMGMEPIAMVMPYVQLILGVGLIFGIFTTTCALATAALSVIPTLLTSATMAAGIGTMSGPNNGFAYAESVILASFASTSAVTYALLILLSPFSINRLSLDTLIFNRPATILPRRQKTPVSESPIES